MSQRSGHDFKKVTIEGHEGAVSLYLRSRIYCIIKFSTIRMSVVAQLDYSDKFYRSRIKAF